MIKCERVFLFLMSHHHGVPLLWLFAKFKSGDSDVLTIYNAYLAWKRVCVTGGSEYQFCKKNFLSQQTLSNIEDLKGQFVVCLVDSGFLPLTEAERAALNR
jgi:ATP-dependent RNA helicase DHX29